MDGRMLAARAMTPQAIVQRAMAERGLAGAIISYGRYLGKYLFGWVAEVAGQNFMRARCKRCVVWFGVVFVCEHISYLGM